MNTRLAQRNTTARTALAAALNLTVGAGIASAQSAGSEPFSKPLHGTVVAQPVIRSSVKVMMSQTDGDDTYEVTINGDKVTATVNGKEVPGDRVRKAGDKIDILDKNGEVIATFNNAANHVDTMTWSSNPSWVALGSGGLNGLTLAGDDQNPPTVMLGVTMVEPGEMLAEHLELEPGTGVQLDRVVDGLGADKAGLKRGDVIVSFDGIRPVTVAKLREALAKKHAGDKVEVVFLRKGGEKTAILELQKYDAARLEIAGVVGRHPNDAAAALAHDEVAKAQKALEEAMKTSRTLRWSGNGANGMVFGPGGDPFEVYTSRLGAASPEMKEKIAELSKRLSELDGKMSKLDEALERLQQKLDKLNDRK